MLRSFVWALSSLTMAADAVALSVMESQASTVSILCYHSAVCYGLRLRSPGDADSGQNADAWCGHPWASYWPEFRRPIADSHGRILPRRQNYSRRRERAGDWASWNNRPNRLDDAGACQITMTISRPRPGWTRRSAGRSRLLGMTIFPAWRLKRLKGRLDRFTSRRNPIA